MPDSFGSYTAWSGIATERTVDLVHTWLFYPPGYLCGDTYALVEL